MSELIQDSNNDELSSMPKFIDAVDKMAYWSKLFGILTWVFGVLMVLGGIGLIISSAEMGMGESTGLLGLVYIVMAVLYIYPGNLMLKFSKNARSGLNNQDNYDIANGFSSMGKVFTFWGTITLIIFGIYALIIVFSILGAIVGSL